jgi:DNA polymerase elongation subunit (family B)
VSVRFGARSGKRRKEEPQSAKDRQIATSSATDIYTKAKNYKDPAEINIFVRENPSHLIERLIA